MKKSTSQKQLRYRRQRSRRALRAALRSRVRKKQKYFENRAVKRDKIKRARKRHPLKRYIPLAAPVVLSFIRNPEEVSKFIAQLRDYFDKRTPVWVVLKNVKELDYDAITVLLSVVVRFKSKKILFNGDFPDDAEIRKTLEESSFFSYLREGKFSDDDSYALATKSSILTHAMRKVDSKLGEQIIDKATQTVWAEKRRCPGVQRTFIELMQNTNNHASLEKEGDRHWWLSIQHDNKQHRVKFSFVDYGVGVFVNLKNKKQDNKFFGILDRLYEKFAYGNNAEILKLIFAGELHRTASGKPFRGKGLPGIYEAFTKGKISNFAMITNNVFFNSNGNNYQLLDNPFQGTFVYWEITENDKSLPYEN